MRNKSRAATIERVELRANDGDVLTSIHCDIMHGDVVTTRLDRQFVAEKGREAQAMQGALERVPDNCPLFVDLQERTLADFNACRDCGHATLRGTFGPIDQFI